MGSFAQISLGILILGGAFIIGRYVHQQNQQQQTQQSEALNEELVEDTQWQNREDGSLFEFEAPSIPDNFQAFGDQRPRPALPFSRSEGGSGMAQADIVPSRRFGGMPNHLSGVPAQPGFETTIEPNSSLPVAPEMLAPPVNPESGAAAASRTDDVPLVEPDFSGLSENGSAPPVLNYLPGQFFTAPGENNSSLLRLHSGNETTGREDGRPAAPEFTIYPEASRPSATDFQSGSGQNPNSTAQNTRQEITPIGEPLTPPVAPSRARDSLADYPDPSGGQFTPVPPTNGDNTRSWIDDFNEPFVSQNGTVSQNATTPEEPYYPEGARSVLQTQETPRPDQVTQPRPADASMIPFGLNEQAQSRLVDVQTRQSAFKISTEEFVSRTTRRGDTLQKLATEYYGSPSYYLDIYLANQDVLRNPADVPTGITLRIPVYN